LNSSRYLKYQEYCPLNHKKCLTLVCALTICLSAICQCGIRDILWRRIDILAHSGLTADAQLKQLELLQKSLSDCRETPDSSDAYILQRIGVTYYLKTDFLSAVRYTLESLELLNNLQNRIHISPKQKFRCYQNLEIYYDSLNLTTKKYAFIDSCINIGLSSKMTDSVLIYPICQKINYLFNIGDYERCIQYASLCQNLSGKYKYEHADIIRRVFSWKVNALLLLKDYAMAGEELSGKIEEYRHFHGNDYLGNIYSLWAGYYIGSGKLDSVLFYDDMAFRFNLKRRFDVGCASSLGSMGNVYSEYLEDYTKALSCYFSALKFADSVQSISIYDNIGNVYVKKNQFDSAYYYYQKAFDQIYAGANETGLLKKLNNGFANNMAEHIVTLVLDKADAHLSQFRQTGNRSQLAFMVDNFRKADQLMDKLKEEQSEILSKLSWRRNTRRLYEHAIEASWLAKNSEDGLYFFEKSRAVLLDDQLRESRLMKESDVLKRYRLKRSLMDLESQLDTTNILSDNYARLQIGIIKIKEEQDQFLRGIREKDPLSFARNTGGSVVNIPDIRKSLLDDQKALLEIFDGDSSIFILLITDSGSSISKIEKKLFDSLSRKFISLVSNPDILNGQFGKFVQVSRNLYSLLFPDTVLPPGRIIISPDGIFFPFEALISNHGKNIRYMLDDYSISYTYSARFLMGNFTNSTGRPTSDFMGMAPVDYAAYMNLTSLTGSDVSLEEIRSYFTKPYIVTTSLATKNNFLSNFTGYKIVQLYSHASYGDSAGRPVIYFSDSSLNLTELYSREKPAARLVVLSACETALGKVYKGEGVFSFSREFAAQGIPASVSNLWSVDNEATYRITEYFYRFLSKGLPTDVALREAKLKFIKESAGTRKLPFYWASPILTGKAEIINTKPSFSYRDLILLLALAVILLWFGINQFGRKKDRLGRSIM
jgi:tetratricopeptide (TPR) repeat protein